MGLLSESRPRMRSITGVFPQIPRFRCRPRYPQPSPTMSTEKPKRRPRYKGKNPRHFSEKYKEHDAERYAADVDKVIKSGKTPAGTHRPVMVREVMEVLDPQPGELDRKSVV